MVTLVGGADECNSSHTLAALAVFSPGFLKVLSRNRKRSIVSSGLSASTTTRYAPGADTTVDANCSIGDRLSQPGNLLTKNVSPTAIMIASTVGPKTPRMGNFTVRKM